MVQIFDFIEKKKIKFMSDRQKKQAAGLQKQIY